MYILYAIQFNSCSIFLNIYIYIDICKRRFPLMRTAAAGLLICIYVCIYVYFVCINVYSPVDAYSCSGSGRTAFNFMIFQFQCNSIQCNSRSIQFNSIQFISISIQFNSIQFQFNSIKFEFSFQSIYKYVYIYIYTNASTR